jgi:hypothetical protein
MGSQLMISTTHATSNQLKNGWNLWNTVQVDILDISGGYFWNIV